MLDYADNPDKTTPQRYLDSDLYDTLKYAANDAKTDRTMFVGGINCSKQNAHGEMVAVQKRFGNRGSVVAYHGIQSFRAGEVTPEMAFEIGKETARRMWGDRYQVLVTVHLNTENIHCHFVVNPISFKDGSKFQNKIGDHKELRKISDTICREHGLSVLESSDFYKHEKKAYWLHQQGKKTHRDMLREDVEYCLTYAKNWEQFEKQMVSRGYSIDRVRLSVKAANWQRSVRLSSLGYTKEVLRNQFDENFYSNDFRQKWNTHLPYKPKKFPLEWEMERLAFTIEHSHNTEEVFVDTVLLLLILVIELVLQTTDGKVIIPDGIPGIIDKELFERVQMRMAANKKAPARAKAEEEYLLTTKLFCGQCGRLMAGESGRGCKGIVYHYYKCSGAKRKLGCKKKAIRKNWIEDVVVKYTVTQVLTDTVISRIADAIVIMQEQEDTVTPVLKQQLQQCETEIRNVMKAIRQGILTDSTRECLEELEQQRDSLRGSIAQLQLERRKFTKEEIVDWVGRYKDGNINDPDYRREIIDTFVNSVFVYDDKLILTYNYKDGSQTLTLQEIEAALSSDLTGMCPP